MSGSEQPLAHGIRSGWDYLVEHTGPRREWHHY